MTELSPEATVASEAAAAAVEELHNREAVAEEAHVAINEANTAAVLAEQAGEIAVGAGDAAEIAYAEANTAQVQAAEAQSTANEAMDYARGAYEEARAGREAIEQMSASLTSFLSVAQQAEEPTAEDGVQEVAVDEREPESREEGSGTTEESGEDSKPRTRTGGRRVRRR